MDDPLYDYTMTAIRRNPTIHAFCMCLCRQGKPGKMALVAAMPKLFLILNAVIRDYASWRQNPVPMVIEA